MSVDSVKIPTALATSSLSLHRTLVAHGLDADHLFASVGFDTKLFLQQGARVRADVTRRLWALAVKATGDPCIGLEVLNHQHPSTSYGLAYAWLASSTLERAMDRLARYMCVISDIARVWTEEMPTGTRVALRAARGEAMLPAAMQDSFFGGLVTACRATLGEKFTPLQVQFRHSEPACADRIEAFFRCPISYDGPDSSMLVSHDDIHAPLPTANVELALANDKIMQDYLARQDKANIVARVRLFVVQNLPLGVVSSADLARALEMSSRSLQRRLAESGTSYWQILDETRKEIAVERLLDKSTSVSEIAYMLGFAEAASLNRAFHRWTARTPSEFRAETV